MRFQEKVWELIKKVPKGKITTYKIIAEKLGTKAYRAVGTTCAKNPYAPIVPCHRVVNSNGSVGNFSARGGMKAKINLLKKEGIEIKNNYIVSFKEKLFKF